MSRSAMAIARDVSNLGVRVFFESGQVQVVGELPASLKAEVLERALDLLAIAEEWETPLSASGALAAALRMIRSPHRDRRSRSGKVATAADYTAA